MLARLGRFTFRHRRAVLVASLLFVVASFAVASGVADRLTTGGFADPNAESERAASILDHEFHTKDPNLVLLVTAKHGATVDDPAVAAAGARITSELAATRHLRQVASYWSLQDAPPLKSRDGHQALVLGVISGSDSQVADRIGAISDHFTRDTSTVRVAVGGRAEVNHQVNDQIQSDLVRAEGLAFPITLVLLVIVFGSLVAAGLPLLVGVVAIAGSFLALFGISSVTSVSVYSLNLTTAMGLGLAIDYSLFIVSRYREELRAGGDIEDAIVRTVRTAGRTVLGSALTVAVALGALMLFPLAFLRSFAYAGIAVSLLAAAGAVVALPALLAVLGRRVDSLRLFRHRDPKPVGEGVWHRVATLVMRRPVPIATAVILLLVILGLPFLDIQFGLPDDRVLPAHLSSRQVQDDIRTNFTSNEAAALQVAVPGLSDPNGHRAEIAAYATALSKLAGVARVDALTGSYARGRALPVDPAVLRRFESGRGTWLSVVPSVEPLSPAGEQLAHDVRDLHSPIGQALVTGPSAQLVDSKESLFGRMPLAAIWIAVATFVLLFLMFGSVVVPVKALVLNVLSLSATFGAMVWIFQEGHLASVLGFTATGSLAATMPILMFCVAFGLSMDYEVFLLSRIKEEHDRTHDNPSSVAVGLEHTGRIVTAAAVLISVVFIAFSTSGVSFIKLFGVGLALAVLMDAFVIRATLVPAFMRLAGEVNWWAPRPLRRFYERFGIAERSGDAAGATPSDRAGEPAPEPVGVS
ncbi:MAG TPA: MMPL family transporter [Acidimicrobiia bacterium]|nr:MMPL family transporter [Acidimicrobiia bacterium]